MGERFGPYQHIGISIEARLETDERYSFLMGNFNQFELYMLWATETDLISRRTDLYNNTVQSYPLDLDQRQPQFFYAR